MELLQLKYFIKVAELSSTTKAAEQLHVAQPSVSQAILRLERELDVQLFDRVGRSIVLNNHGEILYRGVKRMLDSFDQTLHELELYKHSNISPLSVKIWPYSTLCAKLLKNFHDKYPYIKLKVTQEEASESDVELFVDGPMPHFKYAGEVLLQETIDLVVYRSHPFAAYDSIPLNKAKDESFIMRSKDIPLRRLIENYCTLAGFTPSIVCECDNSDTVASMVSLNAGIGFLTAQTSIPSLSASSMENIKRIHIEAPSCIRTINIAISPGKEYNPSVIMFTAFARTYLENYGVQTP